MDSDQGGGRARRKRIATARALAGQRLKRFKKSSTPPSASAPKRRDSVAEQQLKREVDKKRAKSGEAAQDDQTRRYCLERLREILRPMFQQHALQREVDKPAEDKVEAAGEQISVEIAKKERGDEEQAALNEKVITYANELEKCMMETYAEHDAKSGRPSAGRNYK